MKKWIRIKGVAAFLGITATIVLFALLVADTLVKKAIETTGTLLVGARVELAEADLSFFPAGLTLSGLQVTNPDAPMTNAVEATRIAFAIETAPLFFRKILIPEMSATGIRFATDRSHSGAVTRREKKKAPPDAETPDRAFPLPTLEMNDPKKILENEKLTSVEEAQKIQADIKRLKTEYKARIAALPDDDDFKAYEERIKALKSGKSGWQALLTKAADLKKITDEVKQDLDTINAVKKELRDDITALEKRISALPDLAKTDYRRLKEEYGPSALGLDNVTALLFGEAYKGKVETAIGWYRKIQPLLEKKSSGEAVAEGQATKNTGEKKTAAKRIRGKGIDIAFAEKRPLPDFLITAGALQVEVPAGTLSGTLANVTAQQPLVGRPMGVTLSGDKLKGLDAVEVSATLDRVTPGSARDRFRFSGRGIAIKPVGSEEAIRMETALAAVTGEAEVASATSLDAGLTATMSKVRFATPTDPGTVQQAIGRSLAGINGFTIHASAKGPLDDYTLGIDSDLDTLLKKALKNATGELTAQFDRKLQAAIREKTGASASAASTDLSGITDMAGELATKLQEGKGLLQ